MSPTAPAPCDERENVIEAENLPWDERDLTSDEDVLLDTLTGAQPEHLAAVVRQLAQPTVLDD